MKAKAFLVFVQFSFFGITQSIMLYLLIGSLTGLLSCLILHYTQHFRLKSCYKARKSFIVTTPSSPSHLSPKQRLSRVLSGAATPNRDSLVANLDIKVILICSALFIWSYVMT